MKPFLIICSFEFITQVLVFTFLGGYSVCFLMCIVKLASGRCVSSRCDGGIGSGGSVTCAQAEEESRSDRAEVACVTCLWTHVRFLSVWLNTDNERGAVLRYQESRHSARIHGLVQCPLSEPGGGGATAGAEHGTVPPVSVCSSCGHTGASLWSIKGFVFKLLA